MGGSREYFDAVGATERRVGQAVGAELPEHDRAPLVIPGGQDQAVIAGHFGAGTEHRYRIRLGGTASAEGRIDIAIRKKAEEVADGAPDDDAVLVVELQRGLAVTDGVAGGRRFRASDLAARSEAGVIAPCGRQFCYRCGVEAAKQDHRTIWVHYEIRGSQLVLAEIADRGDRQVRVDADELFVDVTAEEVGSGPAQGPDLAVGSFDRFSETAFQRLALLDDLARPVDETQVVVSR